jgi:hypothetical protein
MLPSFYIPINLVRLDERTQNIYIIAGEETEIEITPDGTSEFLPS